MKHARAWLIVMLTLLLSVPVFSLRQIHFKNLWIRKTKSVQIQSPITAYIEDSDKTLHLKFLEILGDVTVCVKDESGKIVYVQFVETLNESSLVIPLTNQKGNYVISISNEYNNVEGEFEI